MSTLEYKKSYRRHLPHIQPADASFFITIRLTGSLPKGVLEELQQAQIQAEQSIKHIEDPIEQNRQRYRNQRLLFAKYDSFLDSAQFGPTWLSESKIAQLVYDSILYRNNKVYSLDAFSLMSNHGHLVFKPLSETVGQDGILPHSLAKIMHSLKRYTSREANEILGRTGEFWQHESYDHVIRDEQEWQRIIEYVLNNPVKAGLVDSWENWPWTYFYKSGC